jgi:hypothetical protein
MTTITTKISADKVIGSVVVRTTHENVEVYSMSNPNRVAVSVDFRGYYTPGQIDSLIEMLTEAKQVAEGERLRMQHGSLFDTTNVNGDSRNEPQ